MAFKIHIDGKTLDQNSFRVFNYKEPEPMADKPTPSDVLLKFMGGVALVVCTLAVAPLFSTMAGIVVGWMVGHLWGNTILGIMGQLGLKGVEMWQLGATLGFVGGFFRYSPSTRKES